jgi:hypothetical protein
MTCAPPAPVIQLRDSLQGADKTRESRSIRSRWKPMVLRGWGALAAEVVSPGPLHPLCCIMWLSPPLSCGVIV